MAVQIQLRRGTAAAWTAANTLLAQGEVGIETDTDKFKIGDGVTLWNALPYASGMASNASTNFVQASAAFAGTNASGTINSTGISVSVAPPAAASVNFSAGSTSNNLSAVTFSNSNGVSFGIGTGANSGVITGTVATNYQSAGAYLTTAALSQDSSKYAGTNTSVATTAGSDITLGVNTSGVTIGYPKWLTTAQSPGAYLTTAALSQDSSKYAGTSTGITGGSVTLNTSGIAINLPAYLTTAMASNRGTDFVQATAAFAGTNASGTINSTGISVSVAAALANIKVSAGTLSSNRSDVTFGDSNGVSWGLNTNGVITATVATNYQSSGAYLTTAMQSNAATISNIKVSAGTLSANRSDITFSDSNGISWGLNTNGVVTATVATNYQSSGAYLTTAALSQDSSKYAGTNAAITGGSITVNTSGVSVNLPAYLTTARASTDAIGLNTAQTNVTWTVNSAGLSLNAGGYAGTISGATNCSVTVNTSGVSVNVPLYSMEFYDPYPHYGASIVNFGPMVAGSWYFGPFVLPLAVSGGRVNMLQIGTSSNSVLQDLVGAFQSDSTGTLNQSYTYSKAIAFYSQGTGSNSTRLESIWSNSFSWAWSKVVNVSLSQASNINISVAHSFNYISDIGSDGATTSNQFASSSAATVANSSTASTAYSNVASSIRRVVGVGIVQPVAFNTTLLPGAYWFAEASSFTRASATTGGLLATALDYSVSADDWITRVNNNVFVNWGSTVANSRSAYLGACGVYTGAANMAPPQFVALSSDLATVASQAIPYFNFMVRGLTK